MQNDQVDITDAPGILGCVAQISRLSYHDILQLLLEELGESIRQQPIVMGDQNMSGSAFFAAAPEFA